MLVGNAYHDYFIGFEDTPLFLERRNDVWYSFTCASTPLTALVLKGLVPSKVEVQVED